MDWSVARWPVGVAVALTMTVLGWVLAGVRPVLLSSLALVWFAAVVAVLSHPERPVLTEGGLWAGAFGGVTTYVMVTLQGTLDVKSGVEFVVVFTALGLALFAAGVGAMLTEQADRRSES